MIRGDTGAQRNDPHLGLGGSKGSFYRGILLT